MGVTSYKPDGNDYHLHFTRGIISVCLSFRAVETRTVSFLCEFRHKCWCLILFAYNRWPYTEPQMAWRNHMGWMFKRPAGRRFYVAVIGVSWMADNVWKSISKNYNK